MVKLPHLTIGGGDPETYINANYIAVKHFIVIA